MEPLRPLRDSVTWGGLSRGEWRDDAWLSRGWDAATRVLNDPSNLVYPVRVSVDG